MQIYIILLGIVLIFALLEIQTERNSPKYQKERKIYFWGCFISLWIIGIVRAEFLGSDLGNYAVHFYNVGKLSVADTIKKYWDSDVGYYLLNNLIYKYISTEFLVFRNIIYTVTLGLFSIAIYKKSDYPAMSFLILLGLEFLSFLFSGLRQGVALGLCLLAYICWEEDKYFPFILLVFFAMLFHLTAIFFPLIVVFTGFKRTKLNLGRNVLFLCVAIVLAAILMPQFVSIYQGGRYENRVVQGEGLWLLLFYMTIGGILLRALYMTNKTDMHHKLVKQFDASCGAIYMQTGAIFFSLFTRICSYFSGLLILTVPSILGHSKEKSIWRVAIIAMFVFMYLLSLSRDLSAIVPYSF